MGVRMKLFMLPLSLTAVSLALDLDFASDVAFDCPMLETKINGALSEVLADVTSWEECATYCAGFPACQFWTLSSMAHNYCYLWSTMNGMSNVPNNISGEKECLG